MGTPSIAHYGTTIIEAEPNKDRPLSEAPKTGDLAKALRFFEIMQFEPLIENMYDGIGRQCILGRGKPTDIDYVEVDNFTSFRAVKRPDAGAPRVGDTHFRLTHKSPQDIYRAWKSEGLVSSLLSVDDESAFLDRKAEWTLFRAAHGQIFEFGPTQKTRAGNHAVYVWTDPGQIGAIAKSFCAQFGLEREGTFDFYGQADAQRLVRASPGITINLLTPKPGGEIAPRWSDDIFLEAGYAHFRLGAPDKTRTRTVTKEAFPDGGDVSFVYFHDSYLELVQIGDDDPALVA